MTQTLKIGFITIKSNYSSYYNIRQVNTYLPVEIVHISVGDSLELTLNELVNNVENAVLEFNTQGINKIIFGLSSNIIINWALGIGLNNNEGYFCDKVERWASITFFCSDNSLAINGNTNDLLSIVSNLYRFADVLSGARTLDTENIYKTNIFKDISLPEKVFYIYELGDNASEISLQKTINVSKILNFQVVKIPVKISVDPDPIRQAIFGGIAEFIGNSAQLLNDYINILNTTTNTTGIVFAVNGALNDTMTNTILTTRFSLLNLDTGLLVLTTLFEIFTDITLNTSIFGGNPLLLPSRNSRNKFINSNYTYERVISNTDPTFTIPPLPINQYNDIYNPYLIYNPNILKVSGILPNFEYYGVSYALETIEYILAVNSNISVFNGVSDNKFRFDLKNNRTRICALLIYYYTLANTFDLSNNGLIENIL